MDNWVGLVWVWRKVTSTIVLINPSYGVEVFDTAATNITFLDSIMVFIQGCYWNASVLML